MGFGWDDWVGTGLLTLGTGLGYPGVSGSGHLFIIFYKDIAA